jgi:nucleolin
MSFKTDQNNLRNFFSKAGNVKDVWIALNEEGRPKGFAHVEFYSNADALAGLKLAGWELDGRQLRLDLS